MTSAIAVRLLPVEEWTRIRALAPFAEEGLPDPAHWLIIVAETPAGEIVGYACLYETVHYEPIWIAPAFRHHPQVFRDLWRTTKQVLEAQGVQILHATVPDDLPRQQALVEKFGFRASPGKLYVLYVPDATVE